MPDRVQDRTVRVFISSTFRDMQAERDHLVRFVFPELEQRCMARGVSFVAVDLRWGVTQEEAENGEALRICLAEIEQCRPFFICLLGERYGWMPLPLVVAKSFADRLEPGGEAATLFAEAYQENAGYDEFLLRSEQALDERWGAERGAKHRLLLAALEGIGVPEAGASITAQEVYHGVLRDPAQAPNGLFYLRSPELTARLAGDDRPLFYESTPAGQVKLERLKADVAAAHLPCTPYADLEALGQAVLDQLWERIAARFPQAGPSTSDPLAPEREAQEVFVRQLTRFFVDREDLLSRLDEMAGAERGEGESGYIAVTGPSGSGKTAAVANWLYGNERLEGFAARHPGTLVLSHFIGASSRSSSARDILLRLCTTLAPAAEWTDDVPGEFRELARVFPRILAEAAARRPILLALDGLDQLEDAGDARSLAWLPLSLPEGAAIVLSAVSDDEHGVWPAVAERAGEHVLEVPLFASPTAEEFISAYLAVYRKKLDSRQLDFLLAKADVGSPLYLRVALDEARTFGEYERLGEYLAALPGTIEAMYEFVLVHLEQEHGEAFVRRVMSCLACGLYGMTERELLALAETADPAVTPLKWARLHRTLEPHLLRHGDLMGFYHRQLQEAVERRYLDAPEGAGADPRAETHRLLAAYFEGQPLSNPRKLYEQTHHEARGGLFDNLLATVSDDAFLEQHSLVRGETATSDLLRKVALESGRRGDVVAETRGGGKLFGWLERVSKPEWLEGTLDVLHRGDFPEGLARARAIPNDSIRALVRLYALLEAVGLGDAFGIQQCAAAVASCRDSCLGEEPFDLIRPQLVRLLLDHPELLGDIFRPLRDASLNCLAADIVKLGRPALVIDITRRVRRYQDGYTGMNVAKDLTTWATREECSELWPYLLTVIDGSANYNSTIRIRFDIADICLRQGWNDEARHYSDDALRTAKAGVQGSNLQAMALFMATLAGSTDSESMLSRDVRPWDQLRRDIIAAVAEQRDDPALGADLPYGGLAPDVLEAGFDREWAVRDISATVELAAKQGLGRLAEAMGQGMAAVLKPFEVPYVYAHLALGYAAGGDGAAASRALADGIGRALPDPADDSRRSLGELVVAAARAGDADALRKAGVLLAESIESFPEDRSWYGADTDGLLVALAPLAGHGAPDVTWRVVTAARRVAGEYLGQITETAAGGFPELGARLRESAARLDFSDHLLATTRSIRGHVRGLAAAGDVADAMDLARRAADLGRLDLSTLISLARRPLDEVPDDALRDLVDRARNAPADPVSDTYESSFLRETRPRGLSLEMPLADVKILADLARTRGWLVSLAAGPESKLDAKGWETKGFVRAYATALFADRPAAAVAEAMEKIGPADDPGWRQLRVRSLAQAAWATGHDDAYREAFARSAAAEFARTQAARSRGRHRIWLGIAEARAATGGADDVGALEAALAAVLSESGAALSAALPDLCEALSGLDKPGDRSGLISRIVPRLPDLGYGADEAIFASLAAMVRRPAAASSRAAEVQAVDRAILDVTDYHPPEWAARWAAQTADAASPDARADFREAVLARARTSGGLDLNWASKAFAVFKELHGLDEALALADGLGRILGTTGGQGVTRSPFMAAVECLLALGAAEEARRVVLEYIEAMVQGDNKDVPAEPFTTLAASLTDHPDEAERQWLEALCAAANGQDRFADVLGGIGIALARVGRHEDADAVLGAMALSGAKVRLVFFLLRLAIVLGDLPRATRLMDEYDRLSAEAAEKEITLPYLAILDDSTDLWGLIGENPVVQFLATWAQQWAAAHPSEQLWGSLGRGYLKSPFPAPALAFARTLPENSAARLQFFASAIELCGRQEPWRAVLDECIRELTAAISKIPLDRRPVFLLPGLVALLEKPDLVPAADRVTMLCLDEEANWRDVFAADEWVDLVVALRAAGRTALARDARDAAVRGQVVHLDAHGCDEEGSKLLARLHEMGDAAWCKGALATLISAGLAQDKRKDLITGALRAADRWLDDDPSIAADVLAPVLASEVTEWQSPDLIVELAMAGESESAMRCLDSLPRTDERGAVLAGACRAPSVAAAFVRPPLVEYLSEAASWDEEAWWSLVRLKVAVLSDTATIQRVANMAPLA